MKIFEILEESMDRSWSLVTDNDMTNSVKSILQKEMNLGPWTDVYQNSNDQSDIIFTTFSKNAWEVHHIKINDNKFISGQRFAPSAVGGLGGNSPNTDFVATAIKLYKEKLNSGYPVRVSAPPPPPPDPQNPNKKIKSLWGVYNSFIELQVKKYKGQSAASSVDTNYTDPMGDKMYARTLSRVGKKSIQESLNRMSNELLHNWSS